MEMFHLHEKAFFNHYLGLEKLEAHCLHLLHVIYLLREELMTRDGPSPWGPTPHMESMQIITEHPSLHLISDICRLYKIAHTHWAEVHNVWQHQIRGFFLCFSQRQRHMSAARCLLRQLFFSSTVCVYTCMCVLERKLHILLEQLHIPLWSDLQQYL